MALARQGILRFSLFVLAFVFALWAAADANAHDGAETDERAASAAASALTATSGAAIASAPHRLCHDHDKTACCADAAGCCPGGPAVLVPAGTEPTAGRADAQADPPNPTGLAHPAPQRPPKA